MSDNTEELVKRGMKIVNRLIAEHVPTPEKCPANPHGDTHCWHWWNERPDDMKRPHAPAECCWCCERRDFTYRDVVEGRIPASPSQGAVHGRYKTTVAASLIRTEPKRSDLERQADLMGIRELGAIVARLQDSRDSLVSRLGDAIKMVMERGERIARLEADLQAANATLEEVMQAGQAKHRVIHVWREGLASLEREARAGRDSGAEKRVLELIAEEAHRLWEMPA